MKMPDELTADAENSVKRAVEIFRMGGIVIIVDDEERENEGDFAMAAEMITPQSVNFMATHGRGLICVPMQKADLDRLDLPPMVDKNTAPLGTAFTVSVDALTGVTTGISAADRARTIKLLADENSHSSEFTRPGHVFPLTYQDGGVMVRSGQTEASVDLALLAGQRPAAVICEIMNEDGTMARMPQLEEISHKYELPIVTVADLISFRMANEKLVERVAETQLAHPARGLQGNCLPQHRGCTGARCSGKGGDRRRVSRTDTRSFRVPDRRCFREPPLRLRRSNGHGVAGHRGGTTRSFRSDAAGRPRHRTAQQAEGVRTPGPGIRHRGGQRTTGVPHGLEEVRSRRSNPAGPRRQKVPGNDEQPQEACRVAGFRPGDGRARAARGAGSG